MQPAATPIFCTAVAVAAACLSPAASGQLITSSTLDTAAGFTVYGDADTTAQFGYDYSADGIPSAPNGTGTLGLKLTANNGDDLAAGATVVAENNTFIDAPTYTVTVDTWINAVGPFPGGGAGSTEFAGLTVGRIFDTSTTLAGGTFVYDGEGGSSRDYRLFKEDREQFVESGQYAVESQNNTGAAFVTAFPGVSPPASQGDATVTQDGSGGFQWMTITSLVDTAAATATFAITSATSGNTVVIGTLNGNVGDSFSTSGNTALVFSDFFASISGNPALSFGVFDNFSVTAGITEIPEPASMALLGLGGVAMLRRRTR